MFGTIRKHQNWLWLVVIAGTVVSFVIYFSPVTRVNNNGGSVDYGKVNGERITDHEFAQAHREVELNYFFMTRGHWPSDEGRDSRFDPTRETYLWLLLMQKQNQLGIHVGDDAVDEMGRALLRPYEREGVSSPAVFVEKVLQPHSLSADDFERYLRHYVGVQELISTVAMSGKLVTPEEARLLYEREHQELSTELVAFDASKYAGNVTVTPQALSQFYSNAVANYVIPPRVQVSYVKFDITNFLDQARTETKTNLDGQVQYSYDRLGTNAATLFPEAKTPEAVKARIREKLLYQAAADLAKRSAIAFADKLLAMDPVRPGNLEQMAKADHMTISVSSPFTADDQPQGLKVGQDFTKAAFDLTSQDPFAGPFVGDDAVYEIALDKKLPRETPSLDSIRDRVTADFKHRQALMLARQAAQSFEQILTNGLAKGQSFEAVTGAAKATPIQLPPFSLSTRELPEAEQIMSLDQLKQASFTAAPGKASPVVSTTDGAAVVYVKSKLPIDTAKMNANMPAFLSMVRQRRQSDAFNQWLTKQQQIGLQQVPMLAHPQNPPEVGTGQAKS